MGVRRYAGTLTRSATNLVFQTGRGLADFSSNPANTSNDLVNNGSVEVDFGKQGTWEAGLSYDAITYTGNVIDSIYNVNGGTSDTE